MLETQDKDPAIDADAPPAETEAPATRRSAATPAPAHEKAPTAWKRRALLLTVPLLLALAGGYWWVTGGRYVSTDNAYIQQDKVAIAAEIGGRIIAVEVEENQQVRAGDLLFRIDPEPFELAVREADARIASAQVTVQSLSSDLDATAADIAAAEERLRFAGIDLERQQALMKRGFTTQARLDQTEHAVEIARDQLAAERAAAAQARARLSTGAAVPGVNPQLANARVERDQALLDLSRTAVRAPVSGRVVQADRLQVGQMMVSGLPALTLVRDERSWVEANFKETDLTNMRVGQTAEVRLDAYPDARLSGVVESIGADTGAEFSVLPAQNATGNWVKVTQRVPVRIRLTGKPPVRLIAGLSAEVTVDTGRRR